LFGTNHYQWNNYGDTNLDDEEYRAFEMSGQLTHNRRQYSQSHHGFFHLPKPSHSEKKITVLFYKSNVVYIYVFQLDEVRKQLKTAQAKKILSYVNWKKFLF
jgi:hypothetical protein